jgi:hypothetical protein
MTTITPHTRGCGRRGLWMGPPRPQPLPPYTTLWDASVAGAVASHISRHRFKIVSSGKVSEVPKSPETLKPGKCGSTCRVGKNCHWQEFVSTPVWLQPTRWTCRKGKISPRLRSLVGT